LAGAALRLKIIAGVAAIVSDLARRIVASARALPARCETIIGSKS
jgi:hypothetical protein